MENSVKKFNDLVSALEQISEDQHGMLIGGFAAIGGTSMDTYLSSTVNVGKCGDTTNTNCAGGNCVSGCGSSSVEVN